MSFLLAIWAWGEYRRRTQLEADIKRLLEHERNKQAIEKGLAKHENVPHTHL